MTITLLVDDMCPKRGLRGEHGLSLLIEMEDSRALVGSFHLGDASADELARASTALAELKPGAVYCSHCTAPRGFAALSASLPGRVSWLSCGMRITL